MSNIHPTAWILALKWYRQGMFLEKIYFALWIRRKLEKKEFLKSYIVLLRAKLNCTIYASQMGLLAGASQVATRKAGPMYDFKNSFFLAFIYIHRAKYIFSRDMFCPPHFWAKIHCVTRLYLLSYIVFIFCLLKEIS